MNVRLVSFVMTIRGGDGEEPKEEATVTYEDRESGRKATGKSEGENAMTNAVSEALTKFFSGEPSEPSESSESSAVSDSPLANKEPSTRSLIFGYNLQDMANEAARRAELCERKRIR